MLKKYRVWLAGIAFVAIVVFVAYEQKHARAKYQRDCQEKVLPVQIPFLSQNEPNSDECQNANEYMPWWYVLVTWPEGIGAWVLVLTGVAIGWQSWETRKSASAALLSAQAVINAERAWIKISPAVASLTFHPLREKNAPVPDNLVEVLPIAHQFPARLENVGKTPAKIEGSAIRYIRSRTHPSDYPPTPDYGPISEFEMYVFPEMKDLTVVGKLEPTATMTTAQIKAIEDREEFLFAYGIIKYRDVYGHPHETRFGYVYEAQDRHFVQVDKVLHTLKTGEGHFRIGGPEKYNGHS